MIAPLAVALLAAAAPDPCAPVDPGPQDPRAAAEYRAVGEAERRAGSRDTATAAFRAAAAADGSDPRARDALEGLCLEARSASAFDRGVRLMNAGDRRGAIAAFQEAQLAAPDRSAALLEGICHYELGEDARALPLLAEAEADPEHAEAARFFRGLVALRAGESDRAAELLESSAADRRLGPMALGLARLARRQGRVVVSVLAESGWDTNPDLAPDGAPRAGSSAGDGSAGLTAVGRFAPGGDSGPFVQATAHYRDQLHVNALDVGGLGGAVGYQAGRGRQYLLAEYVHDQRWLGGAPYLAADALFGQARLALGASASAGATWLGRSERFGTATDAPYSGFRQLAEADLTFDGSRRSTVTLAWRFGLDAAREAALSWRDTGPRLALRFAATPVVRLGIDLLAAWRTYDVVDPALGVERRDRLVDAGAIVEWDVSDRLTFRASTALHRNVSSVAALGYTQIVPMLGLEYTVGIR